MMTNETIEAAAHQLAEALKDRTEGPFTPERLDPSLRAHDVTGFELLSHCLWLLNEIPGMLAAGKREKAMRWLCWCQGAAFAYGWVDTIEELKQANRGSDDDRFSWAFQRTWKVSAQEPPPVGERIAVRYPVAPPPGRDWEIHEVFTAAFDTSMQQWVSDGGRVLAAPPKWLPLPYPDFRIPELPLEDEREGDHGE